MERVLVLNADYTPLNVTSPYKGFKLVYKGKAEILKCHETFINAGITEFLRPIIIRLLNYVRYRTKGIKVNKPRIFRRDGNECVYCGSTKKLTIDHVLPRCRGGQNTWTNMVTCCAKCNVKKADRTPEEANMTLRKRPYEPNVFFETVSHHVEIMWNEFKNDFGFNL